MLNDHKEESQYKLVQQHTVLETRNNNILALLDVRVRLPLHTKGNRLLIKSTV